MGNDALPPGEFLKGHLKFAILKVLEKEPLHGYAIIKRIEESTGIWKPTTGSLYPMLAQMQKENLVSSKCAEKKGRKKKDYCITKKGIAELKRQQRLVKPMVESIHKMFRKILPNETPSPEKMLELFSKAKQLRKEFFEAQQNIMLFLLLKSKGKTTKKDETKVKNTLAELNRLLEQIARTKE